MTRRLARWLSVLCVACVPLLGGCLMSDERVSGTTQVRVRDIAFMRTGGTLHQRDASGNVQRKASYFFQSKPDHTIQLWSWNDTKNDWETFAPIVAFAVPSGRYFDDLVQGRQYVLGNQALAPTDATYQIRFGNDAAQQAGSNAGAGGGAGSRASRNDATDETRLRVGDTRYLTGVLGDVLVQVLEVSSDGRRVRILRSDDDSTQWADVSQLVTRDVSDAQDVGRAAVGVGILVCMLNPQACSK